MKPYATLVLHLQQAKDDPTRVFIYPDLTSADGTAIRVLPPDSAPSTFTFSEAHRIELLAAINDPDNYGKLLTKMFFDDNLKFAWKTARANAHNKILRVRLKIDGNSVDLHAIPWELLRDPENPEMVIAFSEQTILSRFLPTTSEPIAPASPTELRSLIVVASPTDLDMYDGPYGDYVPFDVNAVVGHVKSLRRTPKILPRGQKSTRDEFDAALADPFDLIYLVCHGAESDGQYVLWFEQADKRAVRIEIQEVLEILAARSNKPRLFITVACHSGGSHHHVLPSLGPQLVEVGVPAVIAARDLLSIETVAQFIPVLIDNLMIDGCIDRALAAARRAVRHRPDWWQITLWMALRDGQLWDSRSVSVTGLQTLSRELGSNVLRRITEGGGVEAAIPLAIARYYLSTLGWRSSYDDKLALFSGRQWLVAKIEQFLQENDSGYLMIEAQAGLGKTTFLAHLTRTFGAVHLFAADLPGEGNQQDAINHLAVQLLVSWQLDLDSIWISSPEHIGTVAFLNNVLTAAARKRNSECPDEPILIIIDAIDALYEVMFNDATTIRLLPDELPKNVYVIASQRLGNRPPGSTWRRLVIDADELQNQKDIQAYLTTAASSHPITAMIKAEGWSTETFVQSLLEKSKGVWLYLSHVLNNLKGEPPLTLEVLPTGLSRYYLDIWQKWSKKSFWDEFGLSVLAALAASRLPISIEQLCVIAGISAKENDIARVLNGPWLPFVTAISGTETKYQFYHASLNDFFHGRFPQDDLLAGDRQFVADLTAATRSAHSRFADRYLQAWGGLEHGLPALSEEANRDLDAGYGLRNVVFHLHQAGRFDDLHILFALETRTSVSTNLELSPVQALVVRAFSLTVGYIEHHAEALWYATREEVGQLDGFLNDFRLAQKSVISVIQNTPADHIWFSAFRRQWYYASFKTAINTLSANIDPEVAATALRSGVLLPTQVLSMCDLGPDPKGRAVMRRYCIPVLAQQLPLDAILGELDKLINDEAWPFVALTLGDLARVIPRSRLLELVERAVLIPDRNCRDFAFVELTLHLTEQGYGSEALDVIGKIEYFPTLIYAFTMSSKALANHGFVDATLSYARSLRERDSLTWIQVLRNIAGQLLPTQRDELLNDCLNTDETWRTEMLAVLCIGASPETVRHIQAQREVVTTVRGQAEIAATGAIQFAENGMFDESLQLLGWMRNLVGQLSVMQESKTSDSDYVGQLEADVIVALVPKFWHNQADELFVAALDLPGDTARSRALGVISKLATGQLFDEALLGIRVLTDPVSRAIGLVGAAQAPHLSTSEANHLIREAVDALLIAGPSRLRVADDSWPFNQHFWRPSSPYINWRQQNEGYHRSKIPPIALAIPIVGEILERHLAPSFRGLARPIIEEKAAHAFNEVRTMDNTVQSMRKTQIYGIAGLLKYLPAYLRDNAIKLAFDLALQDARIEKQQDALAVIAADLPNSMMQEAIRAGRGLNSGFFHDKRVDEALAALVVELARGGDQMAAINALPMILDSDVRADAIGRVASQPGTDTECLVPLIAGFGDGWRARTHAIVRSAPFLSDAAAEAIWNPITALNHPSHDIYVAQALGSLGRYLPEAIIDEALTRVRKISNRYLRAAASSGLFVRMAEVGQVTRVISEIRALWLEPWRGSVFDLSLQESPPSPHQFDVMPKHLFVDSVVGPIPFCNESDTRMIMEIVERISHNGVYGDELRPLMMVKVGRRLIRLGYAEEVVTKIRTIFSPIHRNMVLRALLDEEGLPPTQRVEIADETLPDMPFLSGYREDSTWVQEFAKVVPHLSLSAKHALKERLPHQDFEVRVQVMKLLLSYLEPDEQTEAVRQLIVDARETDISGFSGRSLALILPLISDNEQDSYVAVSLERICSNDVQPSNFYEPSLSIDMYYRASSLRLVEKYITSDFVRRNSATWINVIEMISRRSFTDFMVALEVLAPAIARCAGVTELQLFLSDLSRLRMWWR